jgi:hypothetical protein
MVYKKKLQQITTISKYNKIKNNYKLLINHHNLKNITNNNKI